MSVRRSLIWSLSGQLYAALLFFTGTVIVARLLTPAEMGVYAIGFAIAGVFNIFASVGINSYVVREANITTAKITTTFTVNLMLNLGLMVLLLGLSGPTSRFLENDGVGAVMRLLALRPLLMIFEFFPAAMLQREMRFSRISTALVVSTTINVSVMLTTAFTGASYLSLAYGVLAGSVTNALLINFLGREHIHFRLGLEFAAPLATYAGKILSVSGLALFIYRISEVLIGKLLGLAAVGIFTRASQLLDFLFFNVYGAGTRVLFAQLAQEHREGQSLTATYLRSLEIITALFWPLAAGIAVLAGPIINLLYGAAYQGAAEPLALLMIVLAIYAAFAMHWELFVIHDEMGKMARIELIRGGANIAALLFGSALFGIAGAASGRVVEAILGWLLYRKWIQQFAKIGLSDLLKIYSRSGALSAAAVSPPLVFMITNSWDAGANLPSLFMSVGAGVLLWSCLLVFFKHPIMHEGVRLLQQLRSRRT